MEKIKIFETEILINPYRGIGLRTTYWSDGSITEMEFPMCSPVLTWPISY